MDVEIRDLRVRYDGQAILSGVDLDIPAGSFVSVLGPSGCGKTTLLRAIAGLVPVTDGSISIGGAAVSTESQHLPPERREIGWVPQEASLFPHLTVRQNIGFGIRRSRSVNERVEELASLVGLTSHIDRLPSQLSGGQAQRVSLARALARNPAIMLLDEPFAALDPMLRVALRREVADLLKEKGSTALLVTHDQDEALSLSDRIAVMLKGRILQCGTPFEVYERPETPWVARFVGQTVELAGEYSGGKVNCALGALAAEPMGVGDWEGSAVQAVLRPEWIELHTRGDDGVVTAISYVGDHTLVSVRISDGSVIQVRLESSGLPQIGTSVGLSAKRVALAYQ